MDPDRNRGKTDIRDAFGEQESAPNPAPETDPNSSTLLYGLETPYPRGAEPARLGLLQKWAWGTLAFNILVILWGGVVRATGSGAGCGQHWPECDGQIIPTTYDVAKVIEFAHRVSSGLAMLMIFVLGILALNVLPKGHVARRGAGAATALGIVECLLGAALVLFKWVKYDTSRERAIAMSVHHINTTMLIGALTLTAWWVAGGRPLRLKQQGSVASTLGVGLVGMALVVVSGALTALGDTLFPVKNSLTTFQRALEPAAHFLEKLRVAHPIISISVSIFLILALTVVARIRPTADVRKFSKWVSWTLAAQLFVGGVNVWLKAPVWLQIVHLGVSNCVWVILVLTCAAALSDRFALEGEEEVVPESTVREKVKAYVQLTKPRVISLLLFTTLVAMIIAKGGWPGGWLFFWVALGGYMAAGSANTINMIIDRDIDGRMERTSKRPTVTHIIPTGHAMIFALVLGMGSFAMLTIAANLLCAMLAMGGLFFYVFVYTLALKRRTWQNIVIGGAAGAFPPLVGWAAVTNDLGPLAWFLFGLIFLWTPVHFWALALMIKDEYKNVGVPMLPVVRGERATVIQITAYAVLTAVLCLLPFGLGQLGWIYLVCGVVLNAALVLMSVQLMHNPDRPHALRLFKYSMIYLALVFVAIAADRSGRPSSSTAALELSSGASTIMGASLRN